MNSAIQPVFRMLLPLSLATVLLACGSTPAPTTSNNGSRYSIQQDRAPSRQVDIASIPDVVPEPVKRTRAANVSPYRVLG